MIESAWRKWRQRSLLQQFALISLIAITLIGLLLGQMLRTSVERQVLDAAIAEAEVVSRLGLQSAIGPSELKNGLNSDRIRALQIELQTDFARIDVIDLVLWNLEREVVYATDMRRVGQTAQLTPEISKSFAGKPVARITEVSHLPNISAILKRHGTVVEVYQPVQFGSLDKGNIAGVLRTAIPYEPVAQTITKETGRLYIALVFAFITLYVLLFRLVANASAELRQRADENEQQARHDALTGLPNRTQFSEVVDETLAKGIPYLAIALMDLDRFKEVNDTLGHHHGDLLLIETGTRISNTLDARDMVARLGGDEFALILHGVTDSEAALTVARRVVEALEQPFNIEGLSIDISASIGVSIAPDHGNDLATLLQRADVAMYFAKNSKTGCALYDPGFDNNSRGQLAMLGELRRSINEQLVVYYQPKVELLTGRVCGVEALVRWDHPERGLIPPDVFIPIAERSGMMHTMTRIVLAKSLAQLRDWLDTGFDLDLSVNVSARGLHDGKLSGVVKDLLQRYAVPSERLILEITETTIAADPVRAREFLTSLGEKGVRFSIDDFGTGYSSLAVLRSLPVNELKIDREFISDLAHPDCAAIVEYSIRLGHVLGLAVVAEGVEDAADQKQLAGLGCDMAQGYWFARPMPADAFTAWIRSDLSIAA